MNRGVFLKKNDWNFKARLINYGLIHKKYLFLFVWYVYVCVHIHLSVIELYMKLIELFLDAANSGLYMKLIELLRYYMRILFSDFVCIYVHISILCLDRQYGLDYESRISPDLCLILLYLLQESTKQFFISWHLISGITHY